MATTQSKGSNVLVPSSRRLVRGPLFLRQRTLSSEPPFSYSKPRVKPPGNVASRRNSGLRSLSGRWAAATMNVFFLDFIILLSQLKHKTWLISYWSRELWLGKVMFPQIWVIWVPNRNSCSKYQLGFSTRHWDLINHSLVEIPNPLYSEINSNPL